MRYDRSVSILGRMADQAADSRIAREKDAIFMYGMTTGILICGGFAWLMAYIIHDLNEQTRFILGVFQVILPGCGLAWALCIWLSSRLRD